MREYGPYPGGFDVVSADSAFVKQQFGREFEVDEATGTLREIWSVVSDDYAPYGGQIQALPSGNRLWQFGTAGIIEEIRPTGEIVWRVEWPGHLVGNVTPLAELYVLDEGW